MSDDPCWDDLLRCHRAVADWHFAVGSWLLQIKPAIGTSAFVREMDLLADAQAIRYAHCRLENDACKGFKTSGASPRFTPEQKAAFKRASARELGEVGTYAFAATIAGGAVGVGSPVAGLVVGGVLGAMAYYHNRMSSNYAAYGEDPPDGNFMEFSRVNPPRLPAIQDGTGAFPDLVDAANAELDATALCVGAGEAVAQSINKASGAEIAGDQGWMNAQLDHARGIAEEQAAHLESMRAARANLADKFVVEGIGTGHIDIIDVLEVRRRLLDGNWPDSLIAAMDHLNVQAADREEILTRMGAFLGYHELTIGVVGMLTDANYWALQEEMKEVIVEFANS